MENKRIFIAILLSFAVMYGYSLLFPPAQRHEAAPRVQQQMTSTRSIVGATTATVSPVPAAPASGDAALARDITVDTDLYTAVISTRGAVLKKFVLKKYRDAAGAAGKPTLLVNEEQPENATLRSEGKPFAIAPDRIYSVNGGNVTLTGEGIRTVEFSTVANGTLFSKRFTFHGSRYGIDLDQQLTNNGTARQEGTLQLVLANRIDPKQAEDRTATLGSVTLVDNKLHSDAVKDVAKEIKHYQKEILWTGFNDKYFLSSVLAKNNSISEVRIQENGPFVVDTVSSPPLSVNPGQTVTVSHKIYLGPKDLDILKAQGNQLEDVIDFGWFSAIAKPLLKALKFFYHYTGNYGIAIIIITIILKLLFFPLTHKSYKSMKAMQKLQPKMAALKEKYKNDRDAMNKAVMELYQTHKVNPVGGCLPMIVQIPVFFALYKALMFSIELRHAPFGLWIHDLSGKDPYYVTPLIMGVTMFVQQKMTPTAGMDPMQAKMMLALPVVFTFMFLNFPSGLVLYWLVNNILTIAQQYYINKHIT